MQAASTGRIAYTGNTVHTDCTYKQRKFATVGNSYSCECLYSQQQMMRAHTQATPTAATSYTGNTSYCDYLNRPHLD